MSLSKEYDLLIGNESLSGNLDKYENLVNNLAADLSKILSTVPKLESDRHFNVPFDINDKEDIKHHIVFSDDNYSQSSMTLVYLHTFIQDAPNLRNENITFMKNLVKNLTKKLAKYSSLGTVKFIGLDYEETIEFVFNDDFASKRKYEYYLG